MWYWIWLAITLMLTIAFASTGVIIIFAFVTLGLGIFLAYIPVNLLPLVLAFLPRALMPRRLKPIGFLLAMTIYAAYLFVPGFLSHEKAKSLIERTASEDIGREVSFDGVRSIDLHYDQKIKDDPCPEACESLLKGGHVDWVRVVFRNGTNHGFAPDIRDDCAESCFKAIATTTAVADLELKLTSDAADQPKQITPGDILLEVIETGRMEAYLNGELVFRKNSVTYEQVLFVTLIAYPMNAVDQGYFFVRDRHTSADLSHMTTLRNLGWSLAPAPKPKRRIHNEVPPTPLERSLAILALDSDAKTLTRSEIDAIERYASQFWWFDRFAASDLDVMERIFQDQRFHQSIEGLTQLLRKDDGFRTRILPTIFERFEGGKLEQTPFVDSMAYALKRVYQPAELEPYFDRYKRMLDQPIPNNRQIAQLIGRFNQDPTALYQKMIVDNDDDLNLAKAAICEAEQRWQGAMMPDLVAAAIRRLDTDGRRDRDKLYHIFLMASAMGYRSEIEPILRQEEYGSDRFWNRMAEFDGQPGMFDRACSMM